MAGFSKCAFVHARVCVLKYSRNVSECARVFICVHALSRFGLLNLSISMSSVLRLPH